MAARIELSIRDLPEALAEMRLVLATALRELADDEVSTYVAGRLRETAAAFEAGIDTDTLETDT